MGARADVYRFLRGLPANVLAVEYRGYGHSEGSPREKGIYLDAQAAYDYLARQRGIPPSRLISYDQSLGTAVAVSLRRVEYFLSGRPTAIVRGTVR